jgi:hypothetical protein
MFVRLDIDKRTSGGMIETRSSSLSGAAQQDGALAREHPSITMAA